MKQRLITSVVAVLMLLTFLQCSESKGKESKSFSNISVKELQEKIKNPSSALVLDVRTQEEYDKGHIEGSMLIPVQVLAGRLSEIENKKETDIYVICHSGGRSRTASQLLASKGFKKITNVEGGMSAWISEGFPVTR